jgi:hypothetical protein
MSSARRVGVLTFHRCINYGSYWQARCLVEGLRERGLDAVLLDHQSDRINRVEWRVALNPMAWKANAALDRPLYRQKTRSFMEAFKDLPLSPPFALEGDDEGDHWDAVLVGSDEVWNLRHPWYGGRTIFWGDGLKTDRLASYAASFGSQSAADGLEGQWADRVRRFDFVSVRDENSRRLVSEALGIDPTIVLDPCLQWAHRIPRGPLPDRGDYVALYGHDFPKWLRTPVRQWASQRGLKLVSIGYRNSWADEQWIEAGPLEFAAFMAGAAAVVTNFFHGCVFSILNGKPFVTAPSDYRSNKVRDLMSLLGTRPHQVTEHTPDTAYEQLLGSPLSSAVAGTLDRLRETSNGYLDAVLA